MHSIDGSTPQSGLDSIVVLDLGAATIFRGRHVNAFPACLFLPDIPHSSSVVERIHTLTRIERAPLEELIVGHRGKSIHGRPGFDGKLDAHSDFARAWRQLLCHLFTLACDTPGIFAIREIRVQAVCVHPYGATAALSSDRRASKD
jgi:hypothetical protein